MSRRATSRTSLPPQGPNEHGAAGHEPPRRGAGGHGTAGGPPPGGAGPRHGPEAFRRTSRHDRGTLIAAVAGGGAVLLVAVFAVTAWVAPGFLVPGGPAAASGDGARHVAQRIMSGFAQQDKTALRQLTCDTAERPVTTAIAQAHQTTGARLTGRVELRGGSATAPGRLTMDGDRIDVETGLDLRDGSWCWQSLDVPGIELHGARPTG